MNPRLKQYKHIIWDWNGTLLDDVWLCVDILNDMLTRRKMKMTTLTQYQADFDFPVISYYLKIGFDFEKESFDDIAREYIAAYESQRFRCSLRAGTVDIIKLLKAEGVLQSVLSASQRLSLVEALELFKLTDFFENIAGLDDYYAHSKMDIGKNLMKNLSASRKEVLLIGDTTHDYEVARELGADCLLTPAGHQSKERLIACGAKVCDNLNEFFQVK
ncbi:MAG: HAD family hydrolase [Planctomycetes bacterium HGW-Planctomycetes-1]|nr:MAG: HAD family hydrolase [Planctomycetes bacterium HGW-Planctomycetes-1]